MAFLPRSTDSRLRVPQSLYLIHLTIPLLLLTDCLRAWRTGQFGRVEPFVLVGTALWLSIGLGAFVGSGDRQAFLKKILKPLLSFHIAIGLLFVGELALRILTPAGIFLRPPGSKFVVAANDHIAPGIQHGKKVFSVNNVGLRGPALPTNGGNFYRVITVGGSTTECVYLDDSEEWPHLLMNQLNAVQDRQLVWVANAGEGGHTTVHHLNVIQTLPVFGDAQMLIFLIGINDLQDTLAFEGARTQSELERSAAEFLEQLRAQQKWAWHSPLLSNSRIYQALQYPLAQLKREGRFESGAAVWYGTKRSARAGSKVLSLPDLGVGLSEYRQRILALSSECRKRQLRCLFLTQPTMWRENLTAEEQKLLWFGWIGRKEKPKGYGSVDALDKAMSLYNQTLLETCAPNKLECYDLAAFIPKDTSALFDDCHFNVGGARIVAKLLASYLLSRPPFVARTVKPKL